MGTINYRRSDIVTLGYNADYELEDGFDEEDKRLQDEDAYYNSKYITEKYDFYWFKAEIKGWYYDWYYLDLDKDYETKYLEKDDIEEIKDEINKLKQMLIELIQNSEMYVCYPWWCTTWLNYEESIGKINEAMNTLELELEGANKWQIQK